MTKKMGSGGLLGPESEMANALDEVSDPLFRAASLIRMTHELPPEVRTAVLDLARKLVRESAAALPGVIEELEEFS